MQGGHDDSIDFCWYVLVEVAILRRASGVFCYCSMNSARGGLSSGVMTQEPAIRLFAIDDDEFVSTAS